jgi:hypothetical protein
VQQTQDIRDRIISDLEASPDHKKGIFSPFEDDCIRKYYPTKGSAPLAKSLGKTRRQISNRASDLGVRLER